MRIGIIGSGIGATAARLDGLAHAQRGMGLDDQMRDLLSDVLDAVAVRGLGLAQP